jgi:DNA topoisomerase-3
MSKTLVIAEKPSVATDIARAIGGLKKDGDHYEGEEYIVASAVGHLLEIKAPEEFEVKRGKWSFEHLPVIPTYFELEPIKKSEAKLKSLIKLIKKREVDCIVNACDAGREGELIFRYIIDASKTKKPLKRLWLQSMTKSSIQQAFAHLRSNEEMLPLADAAKSRSEADWLVGINSTRAMTAFNSKDGGFFLTTVGRVQTPTLALVAQREKLIEEFVPKDYWEVQADFGVQSGSYSGKWFDPAFKKSDDSSRKADRLWSREEAEKIVAACTGKQGTVTEEFKPSTSSCPALYDLTTLQRDANSRFGFSAKTTLSIAQALYEKHKALTYPRTDAKALPEDYIPTVKETLKMLSGHSPLGRFAQEALDNNWVKPNKKIFDNSKISDHFAIIPTTQPAPASLTEVEQKIYDLVTKRFIAVFFPAAQFKNTTRITTVENHSFKTEGKVMEKAGWMAVYGKSAGESQEILPPVAPGEKARVDGIQSAGLQTKPPARYTEASLLSAMESAGKQVEEAELREAMGEKGIGTPATRAAIIEGLILQQYMQREGRELIPTYKARQLMTLLKGLGISVLSEAELTGEWEYKLAQIEKGELSRKEFMDEISGLTREIVEKAKSYGSTTVPIENPVVLSAPCPKCGGRIIENYKRFACQSCDFSITKHSSGRTFGPAEVEELLEKGRVGPLSGFISKFGRPFEASLKLGPAPDFKMEFDFGESAESESEPEDLSNAPVVGKCPVCGGRILEASAAYVCEHSLQKDKKKCGFRMGKTILQQPIAAEQVRKLLETGKTDLLTDFVSNKTKRKFSAKLVLDKSGKVGFEFEPRKTEGRKAKA